VASLPLTVVRDIIRHRLLALAWLGENMDEAEVVHLFRCVGPAAQHQLFRLRGAQLACQEDMRAHAREHPENMIRKGKAGSPFGDQHVERQRHFEAAANRVALNQSYGHDREIETQDILVQYVDAHIAISHQRPDVPRFGAIGDEFHVATQIERTGKSRSKDEIFQKAAIRREGTLDFLLPRLQIAKDGECERGPGDRRHEAPQRGCGFIPPNLDLSEIKPKPWRGGMNRADPTLTGSSHLRSRSREIHRLIRHEVPPYLQLVNYIMPGGIAIGFIVDSQRLTSRSA